MKLRKFFGLTSRSVLDQVRAELGPDAVIVANRPTPDGIEITAVAGDAMDNILSARADAAATAGRGAIAPTPPAPALAAKSSKSISSAPASAEVKEWLPPRVEQAAAAAPTNAIAETAPTAGFSVGGDAPAQAKSKRAAEPPTAARAGIDDGTAARLMSEMAAMRAAFSEQLSQLAWSETLRRSPVRARFTRDLLNAGFSNGLIRDIAEKLPDDYTATQAQQWLVQTLVKSVRCADSAEDLVTRGGVYALVGPTGVGKTTTTAKLAARCAVRYGASKLALLTTDSYRVGAHDQLRIYAKILGVAVHTVSDQQDLRQALDSIHGKHVVLIDTVGMSQRDERVREQGMLLAQPEVKRLLLLNAASQGETLEEVVAAYRSTAPDQPAAELEGCVLTKLDEAGQPGQALDVVIRHRLFLQYTSSGQRVPEDLHAPSAEYLVHRALRRAIKPAPFALDEEAMSLMTGIAAEALHA
ncbi:MAG TPA: flagellar biosynthesis protein FlhF [Casimicrobiaceae bacterium]|nr:flagellar biosynthesis protein FlhF [Casimicrobiaceae bacterium]